MDKKKLKFKSFIPKPIVKLLPGLKGILPKIRHSPKKSTIKMRPMPIAELSPHLTGILSKESINALSKIHHKPQTSAIKMRPMPIAELSPHLTGILSKESINALSKIHHKPQTSAIKMRPMPIAELSPHLTGILSKESINALSKIHHKPQESAIKMRPMTLAELKPHLKAFTPDPVNQSKPVNKPVKKPRWNSSPRIEENVSYAANRQLKKDAVRKVLNFQPKPKTTTQATGSRLATAFTPDPVNQSQPVNKPVKKPRWNSSPKIKENVSYAAYRQLKKDAVRKVLNYQPKPKTTTQATGSRLAIITTKKKN